MNILEIAIKHEGGVGKLARALGVTQQVVSNWRMRKNLSVAWTMVLSGKYKRQISKANATQASV